MEKPDFALTMEERSDYLYARANGIRSRETVQAITRQVYESAVRGHQAKVLIDVRELIGVFGFNDILYLVTDLLRDLRGKGVDQVAILDVRRSVFPGWLLEPVAQSRGFNFRVFAEEGSAISWLKA
jgi:hypothetical protein